MLGEVLIISDELRGVAKKVIQEILKLKKELMIVAISGESGSGKSVLAHLIARGMRENGIIAKPINLDNYYLVLPKNRTEWRKKHGVEQVVGYNEYDWNAIQRNRLDFINRTYGTMPCVDLLTDQVDLLTTNFGEVDMLILDGLYAIKTEGVDLKIFIDIPYDESGKAKDLRGKEPNNEFRNQVLHQEHKMVSELKSMADVVVTKDYSIEVV